MQDFHANTESMSETSSNVNKAYNGDVEGLKNEIKATLDELNSEALHGAQLDPVTTAQAQNDMQDLGKVIEQGGEMGNHYQFAADTTEEAGSTASSYFNG